MDLDVEEVNHWVAYYSVIQEETDEELEKARRR